MKMLGKVESARKKEIKDKKDTKKQINKIYREDKNIFKKLAEL